MNYKTSKVLEVAGGRTKKVRMFRLQRKMDPLNRNGESSTLTR